MHKHTAVKLFLWFFFDPSPYLSSSIEVLYKSWCVWRWDKVPAAIRRILNRSCSQASRSSARLIFLWIMEKFTLGYRSLAVSSTFCPNKNIKHNIVYCNNWKIKQTNKNKHPKQNKTKNICNRSSRALGRGRLCIVISLQKIGIHCFVEWFNDYFTICFKHQCNTIHT